MMPGWVQRLLPGMVLAVATTGAIWWIGQHGYHRAMAERDAHDALMLQQIRGELRTSERRIAETIGAIASDYEARRAALARSGAALTPIIIKETDNDPRLSDPAAGLTPGLLDAVNRARAAGACAATTAGVTGCPLPAAAAGTGPGSR